MNLIANNCVNSDIYKDILKCNFQNPFCWQIMDDESMFNLINEYKRINFNSYELIKDNGWNFSIIIDGKIKVDYVHYRFSETDTELRIVGSDVFYNKIWEYIVEKYEKRTKRLYQTNEEPIFIIGSTYKNKFCDLKTIKKMLYLNTNYKIIFVIHNDVTIDFNLPENFIIHKTKLINNNQQLAKELYDKILKFI